MSHGRDLTSLHVVAQACVGPYCSAGLCQLECKTIHVVLRAISGKCCSKRNCNLLVHASCP